VVGGLLVLLWALIIGVTLIQKQRLFDESQKELAQLNNAVAQHATGLFKAAETNLRIIDHWLQANPHINPRSDVRFAAMVDELRRASGGVIDLRMVSADGRLYYIPADTTRPPTDVSDRPYYRVHLEQGGRSLYIGDPVLSRVTGKWGLPISLRLERPVSGILVVFAAIELDRLAVLHEQMRLKPNGTITLVRTDGTSLSRTPVDHKLIGIDMSNTPFFKTEYGAKPEGFFVSDGSVTDGVERLISYERLVGYPVTVLVGRGMQDIFRQFELRLRIVVTVSAIITLLALAFTWVMQRSQRALHGAQEALRRLEATDSLTGAMSRRAFLEQAQREISRARRYGRPVALLMLDFDHFKEVNDTHGHAVGDEVLRGSIGVCKEELREQDLLGRMGGEEFCAVLPEADQDAALQVAERLRGAVAALQFIGKTGAFPVRISMGLTMVSKHDANLAMTLERADRALYLAKERGRDRVEFVAADEQLAAGVET
jgi:diguanylate cyclase (GGDEF)-like protein